MEQIQFMEGYRIFIVDDDPWYGEILAYHLSLNPDYQVTRFASGKECLAALSRQPHLITIDYSMPDINGIELYKQIKATHPEIPVIVISGQHDVATAVDLLKLGISEYIVKDENTKDLLWNAVIRIRENQKLKQEVASLREQLGQRYDFGNVIQGNSPAIRKIFQLMDKAARTSINVSITGETGTGKELVAKAIHYNSERRKRAFVAVNMAAIPHELIESELFGHEKGSFTGALARRVGKFEEAEKGTLFLDEIAELDLSLQSKLLRVLQERELTRVGGNEKVKLDVRVIVATHKNLADEVAAGRFREDLYYRIMGLPLELPPLRDRDGDILLLAKHFCEEFARDNQLPAPVLSPAARAKLLRYHFPGNVRELRAMMELATVMCEDGEINENDITIAAARQVDFLVTDEKTLRQYTVQIIRQYLQKYDNNVLKVAEKLDIGKSTIYKMIQEKELVL